MPFSKKPSSHRNKHHNHNNWRDDQSRTAKKFNRVQRPPRRTTLRTISIGLVLLIVPFALFNFFNFFESNAKEIHFTAPPTPVNQLAKEDIREFLGEQSISHLTAKNFLVSTADTTLQIETTLNPELQNYLLDTIDRENSRYVGIVVMEGKSGRVLALAGFDRSDPRANPCLRSDFPAASIFKIVTAAAAIEQYGYSADSPMHYNGPKHTLYKRQLTDKVDRYTTTIPMREAFADSINPVFGKLGVLRLRKPLLEQAAASFGFNQALNFEVAIPTSQFQISDQPYNWAEIGSGFNRETTLSPLHGAALITAILNEGRMVAPSLIENITDEQGHDLYLRSETTESRQIMSPRAATVLEQLMEETINTGTARKAFNKLDKSKVLSRLQIGGKTGSLDNATHDVRFDWFVGFAKERYGQKELVVAVLVGHEKFIGIRASDYARRAMIYYFSHPTGLQGSNAAARNISPPPRQI